MPSNPIYRSYKYRFYPTPEQTDLLNKTFGAVRFLWNRYTSAFNNYNTEGPTQATASVKNFRDNYAFLKDVPQNALEQKWMDFNETKNQFFDKKRKKPLGRMKFKSKGKSRDSFRLSINGFSIKNDKIKLSKIGTINTIIDRQYTGTPKSITVSRNSAGQYFISILVLTEVELKQNIGRSIGIDLGVTHLAILSNGIKIDNPKFLRENQSKLKRAQQHLSRKVKGSSRYLKQKLKVARVHNDISNQRKHYLHEVSSWLVDNYDHIFMENLHVAGMKKNHKLAKSISDASFGELTRQIEYKSKWYGRSFQKIDRWFPSSKTCHCCGHKMNDMKLSDRSWICPSCGIEHDRDINAAKNILVQGFIELYDITHNEALEQAQNKSAESVDYRHGENVSPEVSPLAKRKATLDEVLRRLRPFDYSNRFPF